MSHRRNTIRPQPQPQPPCSLPAGQRSYVVSIDAGTFANVEIVVGGCHHGGVWTPSSSRTATLTAKSKSHNHHAYSASIPPISPIKRAPLSPLQSRSTGPVPVPVSISVTTARSASDAWSKRATTTREREHAAATHHRMAEDRAREQQLRHRHEAARLAEARLRAAAEEEEARRRRHAEQQQQQRREQRRALREERRRQEERTRRRAREIASAWRTYEARWGLLSQRQPELGLLSALTFERIPWPVVDVPLDRTTATATATTLDGMLKPEAIREFLLSSAHSPDVSPKDRIRAALLRWHPDKFSRVLSQVMESERGLVEEGMGIVVRCLNEMLERENHA